MLFNSLEFLLFFPIVTILYFVLPFKFRWFFLLAASYIFYMAWKPKYIILIIISTLIDYFASIQMEKYEEKKKKRFFLFISLFSNLGILFVFKYFNMFAETLNSLTNGNFNTLSLLLPMGISFYTFQTLSYTIDVYMGKRKAEKHFGYFALYVTYFPQLVAGPIERSDRLLPQLKKEHKFDYDRITNGMKRMTWGFFKKVVIADNLAIAVNIVYRNVEGQSGLTLLIATIFFAFQIYCDFSGYSDIAIGASNIMGITLMENFKRPYFSTSIKEFWNRWHISLSTWFRDYVYFPLGGSRVKPYRRYFNIFIVFLASGLWHGADWKFVAWGGLHAVYQAYEILTYKIRHKIWKFIKLDGTKVQWFVKWSVTMIVVLFAWIFFRANSIEDALIIIKTIFNDFASLDIFKNIYTIRGRNIGLDLNNFVMVIASIILLSTNSILEENKGVNIFGLLSKNVVLRWMFYYILIFWILAFGAFGHTEFIYFQF